jgi:hypothetical protein
MASCWNADRNARPIVSLARGGSTMNTPAEFAPEVGTNGFDMAGKRSRLIFVACQGFAARPMAMVTI